MPTKLRKTCATRGLRNWEAPHRRGGEAVQGRLDQEVVRGRFEGPAADALPGGDADRRAGGRVVAVREVSGVAVEGLLANVQLGGHVDGRREGVITER